MKILFVVEIYGWSLHNVARGYAAHSDLQVDILDRNDFNSNLDVVKGYDALVYMTWSNLDLVRVAINDVCGKYGVKLIVGLWTAFNPDYGSIPSNVAAFMYGDRKVYEDACKMPGLKPFPKYLMLEGVDCELFHPEPKPAGFTLGWVGKYLNVNKRTYLLERLNYPVKVCSPKNLKDFFKFVEGKRSQADAAAFYNTVNAYVYVSDAEGGCSTTILEAMACGLPVVCTNAGAEVEKILPKEWIVPVNPVNDAVSMMNAKLKELCDNPHVAAAEGSRNRSFMLANYDWKNRAKEYDEVFKKIGGIVTTPTVEVKPEIKPEVSPEKPLVSILISNYNYSKYIDECIQSCLNQTYPNIEIIVVDDCSTDDSVSKIMKYCDKVKLIVHDKNYGYQKAINTAISNSRGEFLTPLDSDDMLTPDSIEKKAQNLIEHRDWLMVYSWLDYCHEDMKSFKINQKEFSLCGIEDIANVGHTMMFRRISLEFMKIKEGQWRDEKWPCHGDLEWMLRFQENTELHLIKEPLYRVRKTNPKSWSFGGAKDGRSRDVMYEIIKEASQRRERNKLPLLDGMNQREDLMRWIGAYTGRWGTPTDPIPDNPCKDAMAYMKGKSILDVCCGLGHLCHYTAGTDIVYTGVDLIPEFLGVARKFFPEVKFVEGNIFNLGEFPDADTVFCLRTIGQDTWRDKTYMYYRDASDKTVENMDYRRAIESLWSKAQQRLVMSMPLSRPERIRIAIDVCQGLDSRLDIHTHEDKNKEFVTIVVERNP